jgi:hypothetical protein
MALGNMPRKVIWLSVVATLVLAVTAMNSPNESAFPRITAYPGDTLAVPGSTNTPISAFIDNNFDTVVGFSLWIQLSGPTGIMAFQTDSGIEIDTTYWRCVTGSPPNCTDSISVPEESSYTFIHVDTYEVEIGNFDTTGTLVAGWEYIRTRTFSGNGTDLLIVGIADLPGGPVKKGIPPQQGGRLIKLLADVADIADTASDRIVLLQINKDFKDNLNFATSPSQNFWLPIPYEDTNGWVCTQWSVDTTVNPPETLGCGAYERASLPPWDSIEVILDTNYVLDTSKVYLYNGTLVVLPGFKCGDLNGDNNVGNILDLTFMVSRIFRGGPASDPPAASDVNCDGTNGNILDLTKIVDRIFRGGSPLCNGGTCP